MKRLVVLLSILLLLTNGAALGNDGQPSQARMRSDLKLLLAKGDRETGSPNEQWAAEQIATRFRDLGLELITQPFTTGGIRSQNLIGVKRGSDPDAGVITVTAHYDSVDTGIPGADDNGSGTVVMLELARLWADQSPQSTIYFIAFGAEEKGLLGAKHFLTTPLADGVVLNLNLDTVGRGSIVTLDRAPAWLMQALYQSARRHGYQFSIHPAGLAAVRESGSPTDGDEFARRRIPGLSLATEHGFQDPYLHTPKDDLDNVSDEALERSATVINDLVKQFDGQRRPWGEEHFIAFTVVGCLITLPQWVAYLLAASALALPLWLTWRAAHRRQLSWGLLPVALLTLVIIWGLSAGLSTEAMMMNRRLTALLGKVPVTGIWPFLQGIALAMGVAWPVYGQLLRRVHHGNDRWWRLLGAWIPAWGVAIMAAAGQLDYAMLLVPLILLTCIMQLTQRRWAQIICYLGAWGPFLHLASSAWVVQRYGMLKLITQFFYIPALVLLTVQALGRELWVDGVVDNQRGRRIGAMVIASTAIMLLTLYAIPFGLVPQPTLVTISEYYYPGVVNVRLNPRDPVSTTTISGLGMTIPLTPNTKPSDEYRGQGMQRPPGADQSIYLHHVKETKDSHTLYHVEVDANLDCPLDAVVTIKSDRKIEFDVSAHPGVRATNRGNELEIVFPRHTPTQLIKADFTAPTDAMITAVATLQIKPSLLGASPWHTSAEHLILQRKVYIGDVVNLN